MFFGRARSSYRRRYSAPVMGADGVADPRRVLAPLLRPLAPGLAPSGVGVHRRAGGIFVILIVHSFRPMRHDPEACYENQPERFWRSKSRCRLE
jgi:hypothetical protein